MDCWTAYHNGDHISSTDLLEMICETYLVITILEKRGERFYLATSTLRKDYDVLLSMAQARGLDKAAEKT